MIHVKILNLFSHLDGDGQGYYYYANMPGEDWGCGEHAYARLGNGYGSGMGDGVNAGINNYVGSGSEGQKSERDRFWMPPRELRVIDADDLGAY